MTNSPNSSALLIDFQSVAHARHVRDGSPAGNASPRLLLSMADLSHARPQSRDHRESQGLPPTVWWEITTRQSSRVSASRIDGAVSLPELAIAGLRGCLRDKGISDIRVPDDAASWMERGLSYRIPNEAWHALHDLPEETRCEIMYSMVSAIHDGRVRLQSNDHLGSGFEYLLLPVELAGERAFGHDAANLMRYLPCLGLDFGMVHPDEYWALFAYEGRDSAKESQSFEPLMERFRAERREFMEKLGVSTLSDLADFIGAFGRSSVLLSGKASRALQDRETAYKTACKVVQQGPSADLSQW